MRRHLGQRAYSRPVMKTEYQDKFVPPRCHTAPMLSSKNNKDIMTRAKSADSNERTMEMPSFRSYYKAQKWVDHPSKLPLVSNPNPMSSKKCCCAQFCPTCSKEDSLSAYKRDYQEWKISKPQPYRLHDNLKVFQGVSAPDLNGKERQPFEGTTNYRVSFIPHPVQPKEQKHKGFQTHSFQLGHVTPKCCGQCIDACEGMVNNFSSSTLKSKFPRAEKDDKYNVDRFLTTTHADYTEHKLPRTTPIILAQQRKEKSKEPFNGISTMKDDYRQWHLPRKSKNDWRKDQISFLLNTPEGSHCKRCHQNRKDSNKSVDNGTVEFECVTAGTTGDRSRSTNGVATWIKCNMNKDQAQMVRCMVSAQN